MEFFNKQDCLYYLLISFGIRINRQFDYSQQISEFLNHENI